MECFNTYIDAFIYDKPILITKLCPIGCGSSSCVYSFKYNHYVYALKVPKSYNEHEIMNLIHELIILRSINHKNIATPIGYFINLFTIIFEYGTSLRKMIKAINARHCLKIMLDILNGLRYLHEVNIVHGDLKPDNIIITNGVAKIIDFSIALKTITYSKSLDILYGYVFTACTPGYCAPEQVHPELALHVLKHDLTYKIDIYQAGLLLYECLTKSSINMPEMFDGDAMENKLKKIQNESIKRLLQQMLSVKAEYRPSIDEVINVLVNAY